MKKITIKAGQIINSLLTGIIASFGFSSCDNGECMYGTPTAYYEIKGSVTEESDLAVGGAKVMLRRINGNSAYTTYGDTVVTDNKGEYVIKTSGWPNNKIRIVCKPDDSDLEADSIDMIVSFRGGKGPWDKGTARETVNFRLKKK